MIRAAKVQETPRGMTYGPVWVANLYPGNRLTTAAPTYVTIVRLTIQCAREANPGQQFSQDTDQKPSLMIRSSSERLIRQDPPHLTAGIRSSRMNSRIRPGVKFRVEATSSTVSIRSPGAW